MTPTEHDSQPNMTAKNMIERLRVWSLVAAVLMTVLWLLGRLLGDGTVFTALLFYIPTPTVIALWLFAVIWIPGSRARLAVCLATVLGLTAHFLYEEHTLAEHQRHSRVRSVLLEDTQLLEDAQPLKLVQWNVFRNYLPWSVKIGLLRDLEADVYVLNELPRQVTRGNWALKLGKNFDYAFGDLMVVACRGEVLSREFFVDNGSESLVVTCWIDGQALKIMAVDVVANPLRHRNPILERWKGRLVEEQPDLVAGDFNTPRRATPLRRLPSGFIHAFPQVGRGWSMTWPVFFPILDLDQSILGPTTYPESIRLLSSPVSDHRLQILHFVKVPLAEPDDESPGAQSKGQDNGTRSE